MFCQNCGKEISDNDVFCTYCGSPTSPAHANSNPIAGMDIDKQAVQSMVASVKDLFILAVSKPMSALEHGLSDQTREGLILGGLQLLVLLITNWIHLPITELSNFVDMSSRFKIAFAFTLIVAAVIALTALVTFLFIKKDKSEYTYVKVLSAYCTMAAYGSLGTILLFLMGFAGIGLSAAVLVLTICCWCILSITATYHLITGDEDKKTILTLLISLIVFAISAFVAVILLRAMASNAISSILDSYSYLF